MKKTVWLLILPLLLTNCAPKKTQINFEKVVFHSSACFGNCPVYMLQVNKDKTLLLCKEETKNRKSIVGSREPMEKECYTGIVSDEKYEQLLTELTKTDTVSFKGQNCCDAPMKTIIVYYNGKRKYVKTMFPPKEAEKLISVLYEICKSDDLIKSDEKFEIEEDLNKE